MSKNFYRITPVHFVHQFGAINSNTLNLETGFMLMAMVRQDIEKGITKDWGAFVGETRGYSVNEGAELEIMSSLQQYVPFCTFKVLPVATESKVNEMIKALTG